MLKIEYHNINEEYGETAAFNFPFRCLVISNTYAACWISREQIMVSALFQIFITCLTSKTDNNTVISTTTTRNYPKFNNIRLNTRYA